MKKTLFMMFCFVIFFAVYCDEKKIYEIEEIGDSYLPNIHWKELIGEDYFDADTLFLKSNESAQLRIEIFYDNQEDFRVITISCEYNSRLIEGYGGHSASFCRNTDSTLDSLFDKIIINSELTAKDHKLFAYEAIIYEPSNTNFDLKHYKTIYIANPDSFKINNKLRIN